MESSPERFRLYQGLESNTDPFTDWFEHRDDEEDVDECEEDFYDDRDDM